MHIDFSKRIFGLDIMRAVAILLVVCSHSLWIVPGSKGLIPDLLSLSGVIGVEIFFVLSGFLIGRIIYKIIVSDTLGFKKIQYFWIRRWFRTLPNYYLVLLINIVLTLILGSQLPLDIWKYFIFLQNFSSEIPLFFTESWSLPIEEFAYIIGPLFMYLALLIRLRINKSKVFLIVTVLIIFFFIISKVVYNQGAIDKNMLFWNLNLKSVTIYRIDAIYYGVLAAYISMVIPEKWKKITWLSFFVGVFIFLGLNFIISVKGLVIEKHPFFWNVLYLPINSVAIAFTLPLLSNIKSAPKLILIPVTIISLISYSMYLLHYSIVLRLLKVYVPTDVTTQGSAISFAAIYIFTTIFLSYFLYILFEKPMMDIRDKSIITSRFIK